MDSPAKQPCRGDFAHLPGLQLGYLGWLGALQLEALAILFVLGFCGFIVIGPIVALVQAVKARRKVRQLEEDLYLARRDLDRLQLDARNLDERLNQIGATQNQHVTEPRGLVPQRPERAPNTPSEAAPRPTLHPLDAERVAPSGDATRVATEWLHATSAEPAHAPASAGELGDSPEPVRKQSTVSEAPIESTEPVRPPAAATTPVSEASTQTGTTASQAVPLIDNGQAATNEHTRSSVANQPPAPFDLEGLIGVRLFAWLGGGALFLAAALFLHYSIQRNLISPPVRVALGLIGGALLMAAGDRLQAKANMAGQAMAGAGIGTLYAALFAARALYHLLPVAAAFAAMVLVTVAAGALAVRRGAYLVAVLSLIGGIATPFLLSTGQDQPWSLFTYIALLDLGIAWVSKKREWPTLALLGLCASVLAFIAWSARYLYPNRAPYALAAIALVSGLFLSLLWRWKPKSDSSVRVQLRVLAHLAMVTPLLVALVLTHLPLHVNPTFLTGYLVILSFGGALVAQRTEARHMPAVVAVFSVLAQLGRISADLFDERTVSTLAGYAMLPAAHLIIWWHQRRTDWHRVHLWAAVVTLMSPILLVTDAASRSFASAPSWPFGVYTALHALALVGIAHREAEPRVHVLAQTMALVVIAAVGVQVGTPNLGTYSLWLGASALVFWWVPFMSPALQTGRFAFVASALALPLHFLLLYHCAQHAWEGGALGSLCVLGGILMLLGIKRLLRVPKERTNDRMAMVALHGALCLGFLTAALPILLENQWLTVAFGLEVTALAWLHQRVRHQGLVVASAAVAGATVVRLLFNPWLWEYAPRASTPILNLYLYTFGLVAGSFLVAAHLFTSAPGASRLHLPACLKWASIVLLFVLVNIEIADLYSVGTALQFRFMGGGLAQDMTYSLAWGLFALVLMGIGIVRRNRATRMGALLILVLTIAKVFLHDLWQLGALYRVGSIVGLAVALLVVSYLVQRFILRGEHS